ncbi:MAG: glycosyltransferase family 39 protein [Anaerolineales bacterium]
MKKWIRQSSSSNKVAILLAIAGVILYSILSVRYAFTQRSTIDEGLYQYKGTLFVSGMYYPFQEYGPRTQYGPLAYLIPGYIQRMFGPSVLTGRLFGVISGILALIGLWLVAHRLAGYWWGAAAVWASALNPGIIHNYSFGVDEGLVACLLMWILVLSLKKSRPNWQITAGTILAGILLFTRQNMAPVLPLLVLYIFWQYGKKQGWIAVLAGSITLLAAHLAFWPGILSMWAPWLPAALTPFLDNWRVPAGATMAMGTTPNASARIYGFLEGIRFNFLSLTGFTASLIFWPEKAAWKDTELFRAIVFLSVLFLILLGLHAWAGLGFGEGNDYNTFTFSPYVAYFNYLGILVFVAIFQFLEKHRSGIRLFLVFAVVLAFATGIGFGGFDVFGDQLINIKIPRIKTFFTSGHLMPGQVPLWEYLNDTFGILHNSSRMIVPEVAGLIAGLLILGIAWGIWALLRRRRISVYSMAFITMLFFLMIGAVLAPTGVLGGGLTQWNCGGNVITEYAQVGDYLARNIPVGSQVYWDGGNAVAVLLYVPNIHIFPQQLDEQWNFYHGGDSDTLARLGLWNDDLAKIWREKSNVIIIQQVDFPSWQSYLNTSAFVELQAPKIPLNCEANTYLRIFTRKANTAVGFKYGN